MLRPKCIPLTTPKSCLTTHQVSGWVIKAVLSALPVSVLPFTPLHCKSPFRQTFTIQIPLGLCGKRNCVSLVSALANDGCSLLCALNLEDAILKGTLPFIFHPLNFVIRA